MTNPTEAQIDAALTVLREEWEMPYSARVGDFTDEDVKAGKLREADNEADRMVRESVRRALAAALSVEANRD